MTCNVHLLSLTAEKRYRVRLTFPKNEVSRHTKLFSSAEPLAARGGFPELLLLPSASPLSCLDRRSSFLPIVAATVAARERRDKTAPRWHSGESFMSTDSLAIREARAAGDDSSDDGYGHSVELVGTRVQHESALRESDSQYLTPGLLASAIAAAVQATVIDHGSP